VETLTAVRQTREIARRWMLVVAFVLGSPCVLAVAPPDPATIGDGARDVDAFYDHLNFLMPARQDMEPAAVVDVPKAQPASAADSAARAAATSFWVAKIEIAESQVLDQDQLAAMAAQLQQREVTLAELQGLVAKINALYRERNFVTARAVLPAQQIENGVVRIDLIEARIDRVRIVDNRYTRDDYIARRLGVTAGALADVNALQDALLQFNARNDVKLRALLQPGSRPHTTDYVLQATEPDKNRLSLFVDNAGRESIGTERVGVTYSNSSVTGRRDHLSLGGSYADGADTGFITYSMPVGEYGTQAVFGIDYSQIVIVSGELATFNVRGRSTVASAYLSHPLSATARGSLYGLVGVNLKDSKTDFDGIDAFESSVRAFTVGAEFQRIGNGFLLYARPRLNLGVDNFGGDGSFTTFAADAGAIFNVGESHQLALRLGGQLADRQLLPSAEQFQLGGAASVRGYPEGLLIGNQGYFVSAEYRYTGFAANPDSPHAWQPFLFADHGGVFSGAERSTNRAEYLTSIGAGLSYRLATRFTANLQFGYPLSRSASFDGAYTVHFRISYTPFAR